MAQFLEDDTVNEAVSLPLLPLDDLVVLPGMVVPVELANAEVRAAVEAAQLSVPAPAQPASGQKARGLLAPRLDGKYASVGTVGVIEQIGRLNGGEPAAVVRGT